MDTHYPKETLGIILTENSFELNENKYLKIHAVAMGTKTACCLLQIIIFMAEIEKNLIQQINTKPREWKYYIDDVFSLWDCNRKEVDLLIQQKHSTQQ